MSIQQQKQQQTINELKARITDLEKENQYLAEEAEQALHSRIIAEKFALTKTEKELIQTLVESVVTFSALHYAAYYKVSITGSTLTLAEYYSLDSSLKPGSVVIESGEKLVAKLTDLEGYYNLNKPDEVITQLLPEGKQFYDGYLVPTYLEKQLQGVLFVANCDKSTDQYHNHLNSALTPATLMEQQLLHTFHTEELEREITRRASLLAKSQQKLELHIQQTPLGVIEWDTNFCAVEWNPSAEKIFGYKREEALGKHPTELILPEHVREAVDKIWSELLEKKGGTRSDNQNITKDGRTIDCEWYNTPLVEENGKVVGVASLVQDVSERKRQEQEILKAKEEADKANKAKSEFLANMSHELRTPMHGVLSFADFGLMRLGKVDEERIRNYFEQIRNSGRRLLLLLNDLLDISKLEAGKLELKCETVDLHAIITSCIEEQKARLTELGLKIEDTCVDNLMLYCDASRIGQVITNLLSNAIKFSPKGGMIAISCHSDEILQQHNKTVSAIRIQIRDQGEGIPEDELDAIFDKFIQSRQNKKTEGTGLGLAISKQIIEHHQGKIWAENIRDSGANFCFVLPLTRISQQDDSPDIS